MLHAPGTDPAPLRAYVDAGVSGLILMGDNVPATPADLAALTAAVQGDPEAPVLIGIDEEGGEVQRLPWDGAASAGTLRGAPPQAAVEACAARATTLSDVGISVDGLVGAISGAVDSGRLSEERLDDAVERVLTLRRSLGESGTDVGTRE